MEKLKKKNLFSTTPRVLKKGTAVMLCMILTGLFFIAGCKKNDPIISGSGPGDGGEEPEYPIEIPFTEYSLAETCQWTNLAYDEKVIIINSDEELSQYIVACANGFPEIDFSENSLLLANGKTTGGISEITANNLLQLSRNEYELNMGILLSDSTAIEEWAVALIVEKMNEGSHVELNVAEYPIGIPFEEYYVYWNHSLFYWDNGNFYPTFPCWKNLNHDIESPDFVSREKLSIINTNEELENYLICTEDYPVIDFSQHTLLLASGITAFTISGIRDIVFLKNNANQYMMKATIGQTICTLGEYWCIAILVPKIEDEATVTLEINK
jgi:hypothetical protein